MSKAWKIRDARYIYIYMHCSYTIIWPARNVKYWAELSHNFPLETTRERAVWPVYGGPHHVNQRSTSPPGARLRVGGRSLPCTLAEKSSQNVCLQENSHTRSKVRQRLTCIHIHLGRSVDSHEGTRIAYQPLSPVSRQSREQYAATACGYAANET